MTETATPKRWQRHFKGWQGGIVVTLLGASSIILATPWGAAPRDVPPVPLDFTTLQTSIDQDAADLRHASEKTLDVDVRRVGAAMRAYNKAATQDDMQALQAARQKLVAASQKARGRVEELRALRAYQTDAFVDGVTRWARGEEVEALDEVAADFPQAAVRSRWCTRGKGFVIPRGALAVLFKKRWGSVAALAGKDFDLTPSEHLLRINTLLEHPFIGAGVPYTDRPVEFARAQWTARLKVLDQVPKLAPDYPMDFARGVALFQLGKYPLSARAFEAHLASRPNGALALRARNHMKEALSRGP